MDFAKKANRPDIFKLNMTPKFHFYRDEIGEKMLPREKPHAFSYQIQKGFEANGHAPKSRSVNRLDDRVSLLPPGMNAVATTQMTSQEASLTGTQKNSTIKLKPIKEGSATGKPPKPDAHLNLKLLKINEENQSN